MPNPVEIIIESGSFNLTDAVVRIRNGSVRLVLPKQHKIESCTFDGDIELQAADDAEQTP